MKVISFVIVLTLFFNNTNAQYSLFIKDDSSKVKPLTETALKLQLSKNDFSTLFTYTDNTYVYGFIGDNYQRIRIKFISITKDPLMHNVYKVYGKSMVKNNVDEFNGAIIISNISKQNSISYGVDDELKNKGLKGEFIISGTYTLSENSNQNHSGVFKGTFRTGYYLDKANKFHYDDINMYSDGYRNNLFIGKWTDYKTHLSKTCNWGDYRIPNSGNFDGGAGDFSPNTRDTSLGWQNVNDHSKWWQ